MPLYLQSLTRNPLAQRDTPTLNSGLSSQFLRFFPHVSANPRLERAKVNELCLSCHLRTKESVSSRYMPTIELTADNSTGHPYLRHPVSGSHDALNGGEMSCMSCHRAHGGTQLHLLKAAAEIPEDALNHDTETKDMCRQCHLRMWGLEGASLRKKKTKEKKGASPPPARTVPY
jgi:Doubled CXXCH motif (Paired_CXXCH_1)